MKMASELPSALDQFSIIQKNADHQQLVLFLDYDGTLTPIVSHPNDAVLSDQMFHILQTCVAYYFTAIISGRSLEDVQRRVGIKGIFYAGSHGFEIIDSQGRKKQLPEAQDFPAMLNQFKQELHQFLHAFPGHEIEYKKYSLAIHYRNIEEQEKSAFKTSVEKFCEHYPRLKLQKGKQVINIIPKLDWDKGKALLWILDQIPSKHAIFPLYIGDDITDEDAFKVLQDKGIGILVREENQQTYADYALNNPIEVQTFLQKLIAEKKHGS